MVATRPKAMQPFVVFHREAPVSSECAALFQVQDVLACTWVLCPHKLRGLVPSPGCSILHMGSLPTQTARPCSQSRTFYPAHGFSAHTNCAALFQVQDVLSCTWVLCPHKLRGLVPSPGCSILHMGSLPTQTARPCSKSRTFYPAHGFSAHTNCAALFQAQDVLSCAWVLCPQPCFKSRMFYPAHGFSAHTNCAALFQVQDVLSCTWVLCPQTARPCSKPRMFYPAHGFSAHTNCAALFQVQGVLSCTWLLCPPKLRGLLPRPGCSILRMGSLQTQTARPCSKSRMFYPAHGFSAHTNCAALFQVQDVLSCTWVLAHTNCAALFKVQDVLSCAWVLCPHRLRGLVPSPGCSILHMGSLPTQTARPCSKSRMFYPAHGFLPTQTARPCSKSRMFYPAHGFSAHTNCATLFQVQDVPFCAWVLCPNKYRMFYPAHAFSAHINCASRMFYPAHGFSARTNCAALFQVQDVLSCTWVLCPHKLRGLVPSPGCSFLHMGSLPTQTARPCSNSRMFYPAHGFSAHTNCAALFQAQDVLSCRNPAHGLSAHTNCAALFQAQDVLSCTWVVCPHKLRGLVPSPGCSILHMGSLPTQTARLCSKSRMFHPAHGFSAHTNCAALFQVQDVLSCTWVLCPHKLRGLVPSPGCSILHMGSLPTQTARPCSKSRMFYPAHGFSAHTNCAALFEVQDVLSCTWVLCPHKLRGLVPSPGCSILHMGCLPTQTARPCSKSRMFYPAHGCSAHTNCAALFHVRDVLSCTWVLCPHKLRGLVPSPGCSILHMGSLPTQTARPCSKSRMFYPAHGFSAHTNCAALFQVQDVLSCAWVLCPHKLRGLVPSPGCSILHMGSLPTQTARPCSKSRMFFPAHGFSAHTNCAALFQVQDVLSCTWVLCPHKLRGLVPSPGCSILHMGSLPTQTARPCSKSRMFYPAHGLSAHTNFACALTRGKGGKPKPMLCFLGRVVTASENPSRPNITKEHHFKPAFRVGDA